MGEMPKLLLKKVANANHMSRVDFKQFSQGLEITQKSRFNAINYIATSPNFIVTDLRLNPTSADYYIFSQSVASTKTD